MLRLYSEEVDTVEVEVEAGMQGVRGDMRGGRGDTGSESGSGQAHHRAPSGDSGAPSAPVHRFAACLQELEGAARASHVVR